jgi:hypothetical protein
MTPYQTFRLAEFPDIRDIKHEGRNTRSAPLQPGYVHRGYIRHPSIKHAVRRSLKRSDRQRSLREEMRAEREAELAEIREMEAMDLQFFEDLLWLD